MGERQPSDASVGRGMVRVVVDTNVVGGKKGRPLDTTDMRRLLDESRRGNLRLVIPELVLREASNLWAEHVVEQGAAYSAARTTLQNTGLAAGAPEVRIVKAAIRSAEEQRLRDLVVAAQGQVAPLPSVTHHDVIERALRRDQPFDSQGRNGYRDVVLWETILELTNDESPIIFIARDKGAFYAKDTASGLAGNLRDEVYSRCGRREAVDCRFEAAAGIDRALKVSVQLAEEGQKQSIAAQEQANVRTLERLNSLVRDDVGFMGLVADAVVEALRHWDLGPYLSPFGLRDESFYAAHVDLVESLHSWEFVSAHLAEDGTAIAELAAEVRGVADATMHPSTATLFDDDPRVRVLDYGHGGHTATAEAQIDFAARVIVDIVVNPDDGTLASLATVSHFEPLTLDEASATLRWMRSR